MKESMSNLGLQRKISAFLFRSFELLRGLVLFEVRQISKFWSENTSL